ncbi:hypothetical protein Tsp_03534 [Trichinella spiralis]|uniref:hypothetical protein n=1 Tax=Trichinella spiralis TaxID=6334 RepID=UPI0001EFB620|nr:hypothetical protein Tsp_03534 [Trichinella spiralis]
MSFNKCQKIYWLMSKASKAATSVNDITMRTYLDDIILNDHAYRREFTRLKVSVIIRLFTVVTKRPKSLYRLSTEIKNPIDTIVLRVIRGWQEGQFNLICFSRDANLPTIFVDVDPSTSVSWLWKIE